VDPWTRRCPWWSTATSSARSAAGRPAWSRTFVLGSATGCATCSATPRCRTCTPTRCWRPRRPRRPPRRVGSGRCTTGCSPTRTGCPRRTCSTTPPRSAWM
jgi:hypothetical protein